VFHKFFSFLQQFAASSGRTGGEFYTPACVVQLLVNILQPFPRKDYEIVIYDPCCGSGGMFVQSQEFIKKNKKGNGPRAEDTFKEDLHPNKNADYIITNPPFNIANSQIKENDPQKGVATIIMANGTLSGLNKKAASIRQNLIESNLVEAIITLPNNLFYTTGIAPCVLMVDISQDDFGEKISSSQRILTEKNIQEVAELYHQFLNQQELPENGLLAKIVSQAEIKENNYILVPARYLSQNEIELTPEEIDKRLLETTRELEDLINQQDKYHQELKKLLAEKTGREGDPQGVLIRAAEPLDHHTISVSSLHDERKKYHYYTNGPGKLCRALNIDISLNNVDLTTSDLIYLEDQPELNQEEIIATKRVNIDYAGEDKDRKGLSRGVIALIVIGSIAVSGGLIQKVKCWLVISDVLVDNAFLKNMALFCKEFNEKTKTRNGEIVNVDIIVYADKNHEYNISTSPSIYLLKNRRSDYKGLKNKEDRRKARENERKEISFADLEKIAREIMPSLNTDDIEKAKKIIAGTAKSAGIKIENTDLELERK
ncbi:11683_t:CDS:2, partial [Entrophospora sp. SA101]